MLPEHRDAHIKLLADVTRHAQPGYIALGNLAIDRALADDPGYSMASLIRAALSGGVPPSAAVLTMTPDEVAAS